MVIVFNTQVQHFNESSPELKSGFEPYTYPGELKVDTTIPTDTLEVTSDDFGHFTDFPTEAVTEGIANSLEEEKSDVRKNERYSQKEDEIIKIMTEDGNTASEIAEVLKRSTGSVAVRRNKLKIFSNTF